MSFIQTYGKELFALASPLVPWLLNRFKGKGKLQFSQSHNHVFLVQQPQLDPQGEIISPTQKVCTRSFIVHNPGRETSTKIELVFNWKPECVNLWPLRHHIEHDYPDKRYALIFDSLAPKESIGIHILSVNKDLPMLATVRSDQCVAQFVETQPQKVVSLFAIRAFITLMAIGLMTCVYMATLLIQFLVLKTPLQ